MATKKETSKKPAAKPVKKGVKKAAAKTTKPAAKAATKTTAKATKSKATKPASSDKSASKATKATSTKKSTKPTEKLNAISPERFAVILLAGNQIKVTEGGKYTVEKLDKDKGEKIEVSEVLMYVDKDKVSIGKPYVDGAKVLLEVESQKKDKKIRVFKYKSKSRYRRTAGHRAQITRVAVKSITA